MSIWNNKYPTQEAKTRNSRQIQQQLKENDNIEMPILWKVPGNTRYDRFLNNSIREMCNVLDINSWITQRRILIRMIQD